jgi:hypothetical protein
VQAQHHVEIVETPDKVLAQTVPLQRVNSSIKIPGQTNMLMGKD